MVARYGQPRACGFGCDPPEEDLVDQLDVPLLPYRIPVVPELVRSLDVRVDDRTLGQLGLEGLSLALQVFVVGDVHLFHPEHPGDPDLCWHLDESHALQTVSLPE